MIEAELRDWHKRESLDWKSFPVEVECVLSHPTDPSKPSLHILATDEEGNRITLAFTPRHEQRLKRQLDRNAPSSRQR